MKKVNKPQLEELERLIKILNLTTSSNDGEALSAARRVNEFLKDHKIEWKDILFNNTKEKNAEINKLKLENKILKETISSLKENKGKTKAETNEVKLENKILKETISSFPNIRINKITAEHNIWKNDLKGMNIHTNFDVYNLECKTCRAVAYFYFENGIPLKANKQDYSTNGRVSSGINFTPRFMHTHYNDLPIFIPYDYLNLDLKVKDSYNLKFNITIYYPGTKTTLDWNYFRYHSIKKFY